MRHAVKHRTRTSRLRTIKRSDKRIPGFLQKFTYNNVCDSNFGPTNSQRIGQNNGFKMVQSLKFHCGHQLLYYFLKLFNFFINFLIKIFKYQCISTKEPSCVGPACRVELRFGCPSTSTVFGLICRASLSFLWVRVFYVHIPFMYISLYYLKNFKQKNLNCTLR